MSSTPGALGTVLVGADVVVCCGAGGVGKTTTAAVIGIEAARRGRRVVVVTIDPARRLADALGMPDGLTATPQPVGLPGPRTGELWAMMLDTPAMFERVVRGHAADDEQADRIVSNRFYLNIAGALSGTQEYMASEALHELHGDDRFDLVVVDTPPSRHAIDFLEAPGVLTGFLSHTAFKLMMMPTRTGLRIVNAATQPLLRAIGRVVGSAVLTDAVAFFQTFSGMEAGFRQRAEEVTALLDASATRFVLVTAPQAEALDEAEWFARQLAQRGFNVSGTVVNRMQPRFDGDEAVTPALIGALGRAAVARGDTGAAALWGNLAELSELADAQRGQLESLRAQVGADPVVEVPQLADDVHDLAALDRLATHLFG